MTHQSILNRNEFKILVAKQMKQEFNVDTAEELQDFFKTKIVVQNIEMSVIDGMTPGTYLLNMKHTICQEDYHEEK